MSMYNFGVGTAIGKRTDVSNATPAFLGVMQDIEIDIDQDLKELMGQYKMPVDIAPAKMKVTGKAKFARIQANTINDLLLGQTLTTGAGQLVAVAEAATTATTTFTVTNAATFNEDLGVFYAATGKQLVRVASAPTTGQYAVNESTGVYTIAVGDENTALLVYYRYTVTTLKQITMSNQLMGVGPSFEMCLQESYTNNAGQLNQMFVRLNACRSSKLTLPFKNQDFTIMDFDFSAFADQAGNWGTIATTE